ncbi:hypothetical protein MJO28_013962 [Puccinia striiformis f. sp. tritici]|uniref:Uncharacterized protein n=1 Tax=Puccinia striiformis f. sp. tritici TaxID=168172 RepID=A0ACC0DX18_9BASI|nr:hypothetical protein MJO28_013962 [Puccinia striiformis f. sp. tritici]
MEMSVPFIGFALHGSESSKHFLPSPNEISVVSIKSSRSMVMTVHS